MPPCVRRSALVAIALVAVGCLSPTLPLPPPGRPEVTEVSTGRYMLVGRVPPNAEVFALNGRTLLIYGQGTGDTGEYGFEVEAEPGDGMELWYSSGTRESQIQDFQIPSMP